MYFFDSSAFVKLFVAERGSAQMIALVEGADDRDKAASALTPLEVRSAIRRRERLQDITPEDAFSAMAALLQESRRYVEHPLSLAVLQIAMEVIDQHALRALDALQLATAINLQRTLAPGRILTFVCCDERLTQAAAAHKLITYDPTLSS